MSQQTPIPTRVDIDAVRELCQRRKEAKYEGVWLQIDDVEALLIEAELYRNRYDPATRRQQDAARAMKAARDKWKPPPPSDV